MDKDFSFDNYIALTEFLGRTLGPEYEVALHDLTDHNRSLIAIANGHISGREVGSPITNLAMELIAEDNHVFSDYKMSYKSKNKFGKNLRSSTFYIKDKEGELRGLLCINFDDSRYVELSDAILKMCHPHSYVDSNFSFNSPARGVTFSSKNSTEQKVYIDQFDPEKEETFFQTSAETIENTIDSVIESMNVPVDRMTSEEKIKAISLMEKKGVFMLKGSAKIVAKKINCSIATVYRYISDVKKKPS